MEFLTDIGLQYLIITGLMMILTILMIVVWVLSFNVARARGIATLCVSLSAAIVYILIVHADHAVQDAALVWLQKLFV